jgi:hypothetical protein
MKTINDLEKGYRPEAIKTVALKKVFCRFISVIAINVVCISCSFAERGNGNVVTSQRNVSAFEQIHCTGKVDMQFYVSKEYRVAVTVDSNLDKYIEVSTDDNVLHIKNTNKSTFSSNAFTQCLVEIYGPDLTGVSIYGSGSFECADTVKTSEFVADIYGSGNIGGIFVCDNYSAKISGSGVITATGICRDANISISGSGSLNGKKLDAKNAAVNIYGSGDAYIIVDDSLNADIYGSGKIIYGGEPKINSTVKGSGKIIKM